MEKNYSRFATQEELEKYLTKINKDTKITNSGIVYAKNDETLLVDTHEGHNLVIGEEGSGKIQTAFLPQITLGALAGENLIINDIRGFLYQSTSSFLEEQNYNIKVINIDSPNDGNNYNPLSLPYLLFREGMQDKAITQIEKLAYYLLNDVKDNSDPFWTNSMIDFFTGLTLYLFNYAKPDEINISSIYRLSVEGEEKINNERYFEKIMSKLDKTSPIYINLSGTVNSPLETRGGIISTFNNRIKTYLVRENLVNMLSADDIDLKTLFDSKTAIYIINDNLQETNPLVPLITEQLIDTIEIFKNTSKRTVVLLDEFDYLPPIKNFSSFLSKTRMLNVRLTITINNLTNLANRYGREEIVYIPNIIYLMTKDVNTLNKISDLCGGIYDTELKTTVPLISREELMMLEPFEAIILKVRMFPIRTKLIPSFEIEWLSSSKNLKLPKRKKSAIKTFSVKNIMQ